MTDDFSVTINGKTKDKRDFSDELKLLIKIAKKLGLTTTEIYP